MPFSELHYASACKFLYAMTFYCCGSCQVKKQNPRSVCGSCQAKKQNPRSVCVCYYYFFKGLILILVIITCKLSCIRPLDRNILFRSTNIHVIQNWTHIGPQNYHILCRPINIQIISNWIHIDYFYQMKVRIS